MAPGETLGRDGDLKEAPSRPFISIPLAPTYEQQGYIIGGSRHKLKCHCYACQLVRRRRREKLIDRTVFYCG